MTYYPNLVSAMEVREITDDTVANVLGISRKAFQHKMIGKTEFKFPEAEKIQAEFFSDIPLLDLFKRSDHDSAGKSVQGGMTKHEAIWQPNC